MLWIYVIWLKICGLHSIFSGFGRYELDGPLTWDRFCSLEDRRVGI